MSKWFKLVFVILAIVIVEKMIHQDFEAATFFLLLLWINVWLERTC
jgi:hypothetical protein